MFAHIYTHRKTTQNNDRNPKTHIFTQTETHTLIKK